MSEWYKNELNPEKEDLYLVTYRLPIRGLSQAMVHYHPKYGWRSKITNCYVGNIPKDSKFVVDNMISFRKIFDDENELQDAIAIKNLIPKPLNPIDFGAIPDPAWHETGDLPPVGTECEWSVNDKCYEACIILFYYSGCVVFDHPKHKGNVRLLKLDDLKFRPIQSDRDKAIEEMTEIFYSNGFKNGFAALYDAGFRKPDEKLNAELTALRLSLDNSEKWKNELVEVVNDLLVIIYSDDPSPIALGLYASRAKELLDSMEQK